MLRIAVLALQGAFIEHESRLRQLGAACFEIRKAADWQRPKDGLIIPGGESTTMGKLLRESELAPAIRADILHGLPVFGTCAGLILLAGRVEGGATHLDTMDITVLRNAYGRQLGSFRTEAEFKGIVGDVPMTFIRAPYIKEVGERVEILSEVEGHIVAARQGNQLVTAFHPELDEDTRIHEYFLQMVKDASSSGRQNLIP